MLRHFLIIYKPLSKDTEMYLNIVKNQLKRIGSKYNIFETQIDLSAQDIVKAEMTQDITDILILGGDGTINSVINGLDRFDVPIGIIPTGTGNDFYRMINSSKIVETALFGETHDVNIGVCNQVKFINGVGCALEGKSAQKFDEQRKKGDKKTTYFLPILKQIITYSPLKYNITFDQNKPSEKSFFLCTIANGRFFGNGYKLSPKSILDDDQFDMIFVHKIPKVIALLLMAIVPMGWHVYLPFVHKKKVSQLKIVAPKKIYYHLDGEVFEHDSLEISIFDHKLKVRMSFN